MDTAAGPGVRGDDPAEATDGARVFISYSRRDTAIAEGFRETLAARGFNAYLDVHDIAPGEPWQDRLGALIATAEKVVFLINPDSVASPVCGWEVDHAEGLGKSILPVMIRETPPDAVPGRLQRLNYLFMRDAAERAAREDALATALETDLAWEREKARINDDAMAWDAAGRPPRLLLFADDAIRSAEGWRDAHPPTAPAPTPVQLAFIAASRARRTFRQRVLVVVSTAVTAVTAVSAVIALLQWQVAEEAALKAEQRAAVLSAGAAETLADGGDTDGALVMLLEAAKSFPEDPVPDALLIAFDRVLRRAAREERHAVPPAARAIATDSALLLHDEATGDLWRVDAAGDGVPRRIGRLPGRVLALAPTAVGPGSIAVMAEAGGIAVAWLDPVGGGTAPLARIEDLDSGRDHAAGIATAGIVFANGRRDGAEVAALYDIRTGETAILPDPDRQLAGVATGPDGRTLLLRWPFSDLPDMAIGEGLALADAPSDAAGRGRHALWGCLGAAADQTIVSFVERVADEDTIGGFGFFAPACDVRDRMMILTTISPHSAGSERRTRVYDTEVEGSEPWLDLSVDNAVVPPGWWSEDWSYTVADPDFQDLRLFRTDGGGEPDETIREEAEIEAVAMLDAGRVAVLRAAVPGRADDRRIAIYRIDGRHDYATDRPEGAAEEYGPGHDRAPLPHLRPQLCYAEDAPAVPVAAGAVRAVIRPAAGETAPVRVVEILDPTGTTVAEVALRETPEGEELCASLAPGGDWLLVPDGPSLRVFAIGADGVAERPGPDAGEEFVTSADFFGPGPSILTTGNSGQATLRRAPQDTAGAWTHETLFAGAEPLVFAQSDREGRRLLLIENLGAADNQGSLFSLEAQRRWRVVGREYRWLTVAFAADGEVLVWKTGGFDSIQHLHGRDEAVAAAEAEIAPGCRPAAAGAWEDSPCWPARFR